MSKQLEVSVGQYSSQGRKEVNQDFHGCCCPQEPQLTSKGIAIALADGISSSELSAIASEAAVTGFLEDYYCTSESWSVKQSVQRVLQATNSWLYSQGRQAVDVNQAMVCTFSAIVIKSTTAYLFHVGDTRIYRFRGGVLEQLTTDHRIHVGEGKNFLSRAMGVDMRLDIDYQALPLECGDLFILFTDGIHEYLSERQILDNLIGHANHLDSAARQLTQAAFDAGSSDNLTAQLLRVDALPQASADELIQQLTERPFPPELEPDMVLDGYRIRRELHASKRTQVYLVEDTDSGALVVMKTPSVNYQDDPVYLERFLLEEWVARRISSAHVLKLCEHGRQRHFLYYLTEYIEGTTLAQWMRDNPQPGLNQVRDILAQIVKGLRAFHRMEMLHQDLKPDNIMIDDAGTVRIIDFGSTRVAGVMEISSPLERDTLLGTEDYMAPEYLLDESGSNRSDLYSLGVIAYQMLCGQHPYAGSVARARTRTAQRRLRYQPIGQVRADIPLWVDGALRKAVHIDPQHRYEDLPEFIFDLNHPNRQFLQLQSPPLIQRDPLRFWQTLCLLLALLLLWVGVS